MLDYNVHYLERSMLHTDELQKSIDLANEKLGKYEGKMICLSANSAFEKNLIEVYRVVNIEKKTMKLEFALPKAHFGKCKEVLQALYPELDLTTVEIPKVPTGVVIKETIKRHIGSLTYTEFGIVLGVTVLAIALVIICCYNREALRRRSQTINTAITQFETFKNSFQTQQTNNESVQ